MKIHIGEGAREKSWQQPFAEKVNCVYCNGGTAELAFVAYEGLDGVSDEKDEKGVHCDDNGQPFICSSKEQTGRTGGLWLHDCCAVAVYFCRSCLKPTAQYNQG